ncbi:MAG: hypothetical protein J5800_09965 [Spirochaetales bacterium]|nr:hypothetical protein [Spirochaetales bacterium]
MTKRTDNRKTEAAELHLEKITWDNYAKICRLRVTKEQDDYVARNERSLVHAYIALSQGEIKPYPFGIYLGKKPIGFVMIGYNGCGPSDICWLSYEPENEAAKKLYASFGFVEVPEHYKEGEEMPAILKL